jgi:integrase
MTWPIPVEVSPLLLLPFCPLGANSGANFFATSTFHSLRHSHASALIAGGVDIMEVSRRLGHGSPAITLRLYGHLWNKNDDRAAAVIDRVLRLPRYLPGAR